MYKNRTEIPEDGQLCLCKCPNWCRSGYQVAVYEDSKFQFDEQPNDMFDKDVIAWMPLDDDGIPTE